MVNTFAFEALCKGLPEFEGPFAIIGKENECSILPISAATL